MCFLFCFWMSLVVFDLGCSTLPFYEPGDIGDLLNANGDSWGRFKAVNLCEKHAEKQ